MKEITPIAESNELGLELLGRLQVVAKAKAAIQTYETLQREASFDRLSSHIQKRIDAGDVGDLNNDPQIDEILTSVIEKGLGLGSSEHQAQQLSQLREAFDKRRLTFATQVPRYYRRGIVISRKEDTPSMVIEDNGLGTIEKFPKTAHGWLQEMGIVDLNVYPHRMILQPQQRKFFRNVPDPDHYFVVQAFDRDTLVPNIHVQVN